MAASETEIANRALQKLGSARITDLTENSTEARAVSACKDPLRRALLRAHRWNFAIKRVSLAASATTPEFGRANEFPLPSDCLKPLPPYPEDDMESLDWIVEARSIMTDDSAPLQIRYIADVTDTTLWDPLFCEAYASLIAEELCETLTQSNVKKAALGADRKEAIAEARRQNAIEKAKAMPPDDRWITVRA